MSEQRREYTLATIEHSKDLLQDPKAGDVLSSKEIELATFVLDSLVVARNENGRVGLPSTKKNSLNRDRIPVAAVGQGEQVLADRMSPTALQYEVIRKFFRDKKGVDEASLDGKLDLTSSLFEGHAPYPVSFSDTEKSSVLVYRPQLIANPEVTSIAPIRVSERPMVFISYDAEKERLRSVGALVAACAYVAQAIGRSAEFPWTEGGQNQDLADALEANKFGAGAVKIGLRRNRKQQISPGDQEQLQVDMIRRKYNDDSDPFRISPELIADLRKKQLLKRVLPPVEAV